MGQGVLGRILQPGGAADSQAARDLSPCPLPGAGRGTAGSLAAAAAPPVPPSFPLPAPGRGEGRGAFPRRHLAGRHLCKILPSILGPAPTGPGPCTAVLAPQKDRHARRSPWIVCS